MKLKNVLLFFFYFILHLILHGVYSSGIKAGNPSHYILPLSFNQTEGGVTLKRSRCDGNSSAHFSQPVMSFHVALKSKLRHSSHFIPWFHHVHFQQAIITHIHRSDNALLHPLTANRTFPAPLSPAVNLTPRRPPPAER